MGKPVHIMPCIIENHNSAKMVKEFRNRRAKKDEMKSDRQNGVYRDSLTHVDLKS